MLSNYFPDIDPEYLPLIAHVLKREIHDLLIDDTLSINHEEMRTIYTLIDQVRKGTPLAYVTQTQSFYKDEFYVNRNVLIPRSETEYLVEAAIDFVNTNFRAQGCSIFDVCTGSGCIGLSIAKYVSGTPEIFLSDISAEALAVCRINAQKLLPEHKNIHILTSNLLKNFSWETQGEINVLVSNPPYIPSSRIPHLDPRVRDHEPHLALDGGEKGYEMTLELLREAKVHLAKVYLVLIELDDIITEDFMKEVKHLYPHEHIHIKKDLFGVDRYLVISSQDI